MKRILVLIAAVVLALGTSVVVANPPVPGNPDNGQQAPDCHGANDNECRPDPQPDHGADCTHSDDHVCAPTATPVPPAATPTAPAATPTSVPNTPTPEPTVPSVPTASPTPDAPSATPTVESGGSGDHITIVPTVAASAPVLVDTIILGEPEVAAYAPEVVYAAPVGLPKAGDELSGVLALLAMLGAAMAWIGKRMS